MDMENYLQNCANPVQVIADILENNKRYAANVPERWPKYSYELF